MTIYYSPFYTGHVYIDLKKRGNMAFDTEFVGTDGLVRLLALRLGVHVKMPTRNERLAAYHEAFCEYVKGNPDNVFAKSWGVDSLATAKQCLTWRDELATYGWNAESGAPSKRLEVLRDVERLFVRKKDCQGTSDLVNATLKALSGSPEVLEGATVVVALEKAVLPPVAKRILEMMEGGGCKVEYGEETDYEAKMKNIALRVLEFETVTEAQCWLAEQDDKAYDAWIDTDSQTMDNYMKLAGRPTAGSMMREASPQLLQLLSLAVRLLKEPLDIYTLLQWLQTAVNPLNGSFRRELASVIVANGGYRRKECAEIIGRFKAGEYTYIEEREGLTEEEIKALQQKKVKECKRYAECFLPSVEAVDIDISKAQGNATVEKNRVERLAKEMKAWCEKRLMAMENADDDSPLKAQLTKLMEMTQGLIIMLRTHSGDTMEMATLEGWIGSLQQPSDYVQYKAERGCREVISNPAAMVDVAERVVWCDVYGAESRMLSCSFLSEIEREGLSATVDFWDKADERKTRRLQMLYPIAMTSERLTLVTCKKCGNDVLPKHPLIIWIESKVSRKELAEMTEKPQPKGIEQQPFVDNRTGNTELHIENAGMIEWPDHESHTSLDTITQYPLDYVLQSLCKINDGSKREMEDVARTKGTVAHAVIEHLFAPDDGRTKSAEEVRDDFEKSYTQVFNAALQSDGAILLQTENILTARQLQTELHRNIDILINIIGENGLRVKSCERQFERVDVGIKSPNNEVVPVKGFTDMILEDAQGMNVVFDFKWTTSKKWQGLLKDNLSTQLALYRKLIEAEGDKVAKTAYFIMPEGSLYSTDDFGDKNTRIVEMGNERSDRDLMTEIGNSYRYRRQQIEGGMIENADNCEVSTIAYINDTEQEDLVPLNCDTRQMKNGNKFSNYNHLKS